MGCKSTPNSASRWHPRCSYRSVLGYHLKLVSVFFGFLSFVAYGLEIAAAWSQPWEAHRSGHWETSLPELTCDWHTPEPQPAVVATQAPWPAASARASTGVGRPSLEHRLSIQLTFKQLCRPPPLS